MMLWCPQNLNRNRFNSDSIQLASKHFFTVHKLVKYLRIQSTRTFLTNEIPPLNMLTFQEKNQLTNQNTCLYIFMHRY